MHLNDSALLRQQAYIDGEWVDAADGSRFEVNNPADGSVLASVPAAVAKLKVCLGLSGELEQGPLINEDAVLKVEALPDDALEKGARPPRS